VKGLADKLQISVTSFIGHSPSLYQIHILFSFNSGKVMKWNVWGGSGRGLFQDRI